MDIEIKILDDAFQSKHWLNDIPYEGPKVYSLSSPIVCHSPLSTSFIPHCLPFPIVYVFHPPWDVIPNTAALNPAYIYPVYNFQLSVNLIISNCVLTCHCLLFTIVCHSPLSAIFHSPSMPIICLYPLFTNVLHIDDCLSFSSLSFPILLFIIPIVYNLQLSVTIVCNSPLSTNSLCLSFLIVGNSHCMLFTIVCHIQLSIIPHCLSPCTVFLSSHEHLPFTIVIPPLDSLSFPFYVFWYSPLSTNSQNLK